jgi:hypothetical protein
VDDPHLFRPHERVSLGISEYNAIVGSAYVVVPAGKAFFGAEASTDWFVGGEGGPPGPLLRAGVHGGLHLGQVSVLAFVELAKVPAIEEAELMADDFALIAYEPMITGGLALQGRFGGAGRAGRPSHVEVNAVKKDVEVIEHAEIAGVVTDEAGAPIVGASVTARLKAHTATGTTGPKGEYVLSRIPIGKTVNGTTTLDDTGVELTISVADRKPVQATASLVKGRNQMATLALPPLSSRASAAPSCATARPASRSRAPPSRSSPAASSPRPPPTARSRSSSRRAPTRPPRPRPAASRRRST